MTMDEWLDKWDRLCNKYTIAYNAGHDEIRLKLILRKQSELLKQQPRWDHETRD